VDDSASWIQRVSGASPDSLGEREQRIFDGQRKKWGQELANHRIYARVPEIFHAAQGMWRGLGAAGHLESPLAALLNRRVAILNGCVF
jgi:alkylhydroperoxidase family enzyme